MAAAAIGAVVVDPLTGANGGRFGDSATAPAMRVARAAASAVALPNGKVLIAGGADASNNSLTSTELYDPVSNTFAAGAHTATMNGARAGARIVLLLNGKVLIAGGETATTLGLETTELYTP
jgi:hypothetical protein